MPSVYLNTGVGRFLKTGDAPCVSMASLTSNAQHSVLLGSNLTMRSFAGNDSTVLINPISSGINGSGILFANESIQGLVAGEIGFFVKAPASTTSGTVFSDTYAFKVATDKSVTFAAGTTMSTLTVTGLGTFGNFLSGDAKLGNWSVLSSYVRFGHIDFDVASGSGFGFMQNNTGAVIIESPTLQTLRLRTGGNNNLTLFESKTLINSLTGDGSGAKLQVAGGASIDISGSSQYLSLGNHMVAATRARIWYDSSTAKLQFDTNTTGQSHSFGSYNGGGTYLPLLTITGAGNTWIKNNCSALSFTDRTPYPETLDEAWSAIDSQSRLPNGKFKKDKKAEQMDHSGLSDFVKVLDKDGNIEGRDLSATVSSLVEIVKDLRSQINNSRKVK